MTDRKDHARIVEKVVSTLREEIRAYFPPDRSCLTCDHFTETTELCQHTQHRGQRPPARIIAYGCVLHQNVDEDIPF